MEFIRESARSLGFTIWYAETPLDIHQKLALFNLKYDDSISPQGNLKILKTAFYEAIGTRQRLTNVCTVQDVAGLLKNSSNIIVLTGAGISVSCGIPDFRSSTGIYSRMDEFNLDEPQQMFDLDFFKENPEPFYTFAKEIYPDKKMPSKSHEFIRTLQDKNKLLRNFSQNIDDLESKAGITRCLQCHGSFKSATCLNCRKAYPGQEIYPYITSQTIPYCKLCKGVIKPVRVNFIAGYYILW